MLVVGVTGGIGSGKSTVSEMFARLGARVLDADAIAREVIRDHPQVLPDLVRAFGEDILDRDGSLNRRKLGRRAFGDQRCYQQLNHILHPLILERIKKLLDQMRTSQYEGIVVLDAALLVECQATGMVDRLVVVEAPRELRCQRLMRKGLSQEEFEQRAAAQLPSEKKSKLAHHIIVNDGTIEVLRERAGQIWRQLRAGAVDKKMKRR